MVWSAERVIVTGAGGVLGHALVALLQVLKPSALCAPTRAQCDLLDADATGALFAEFQPTIVMHLAGRVWGVQGNMTFSGVAYRDNTIINLNVVEAARRVGVRKFVAAGTVAVYPDGINRAITEEDIWQGPPHGSEAAYAHAKRGMLAQLQSYAQQWGMDYAYLLYTNLFGCHDRFDEQFGHVVPSLVSRFHRLKREGASEIVVWGDGSPTRDFLFAVDAASATIACAEKMSGPVNIATGQSITIRELVETLQRVSGFSGTVVWDTSKPLGQLTRRYDTRRLNSIGWKPSFTLEQGLQATWDWFESTERVRRAKSDEEKSD